MMPINLNPNWVFRFKGSNATGSTEGKTNNVFNLATLRKNLTATRDVVTLDQYDRYPDSGAQLMVFLDGVEQESDIDFTYTAKSSSSDPTITFLKNIDGESRVTFNL
jgi:hypothetical protein